MTYYTMCAPDLLFIEIGIVIGAVLISIPWYLIWKHKGDHGKTERAP